MHSLILMLAGEALAHPSNHGKLEALCCCEVEAV